MKRLLVAALCALSSAAFGAGLYPVQLLNSTGSTAGQTVVSTGPTSAPGWGSVPATGLSAQAANTVVANATASSASPTAVAMPSCSTSTSALNWTSGTGFTCGGSGFAALAGAAFTGATGVSYNSAAFTLNDAGGTGFPAFFFNKSGVNVWALTNASSTGTLTLNRYVSGTLSDGPISVSNSTGAVTMVDGITGSPISGSTGSFTTLAASSTVSGAGFSNYLASPPSIGGTTAAAGTFTTLSASSNSAVFSTNTSAQSIPNGTFTTITGWTAVTDRNSNWTASTGTFTAPRTGNYLVSAAVAFASGGWAVGTNLSLAVFKNGTEVAQATKIVDGAVTSVQGVTLPSVLVNCATSDALTIRVFQGVGSAVSLGSSPAAANWVSIIQVP